MCTLPEAPRAESIASGNMADCDDQELSTSEKVNTPPSAKDSKEDDRTYSSTQKAAKEEAKD